MAITHQANLYRNIGRQFAAYETVDHGLGEYVRLTDRTIHTNTIEGYFLYLQAREKGTYHHCAKKNLDRYLAGFDFRYNNRIANGFDDNARVVEGLKGIVGKRRAYARPDEA